MGKPDPIKVLVDSIYDMNQALQINLSIYAYVYSFSINPQYLRKAWSPSICRAAAKIEKKDKEFAFGA